MEESVTRMVESLEVVTKRVPSGLKDAELTWPVWPRTTDAALEEAASQIREVASDEAVRMREPSGLKANEPRNPS